MSSKNLNEFYDSERKKNAKRSGIGDIPGGCATVLVALIGLAGVLAGIIIPPLVNNLQGQQTQTSVVLTQNALAPTVITTTSINTLIPSETSIATATIAPTNTDTPTLTVTNTNIQQPTETLQQNATIDLVAMRAATIAVQRTETRQALIAQQTADAIFAAEDNTATANAVASFTKPPTLIPSSTSTPSSIPTLRPTDVILPTSTPGYPCEATVKKAQGNPKIPYYPFASSGSPNGYVTAGDPIEILEKPKNPNDPKYLIADANGIQLGYLRAEYVVPSSSCPQ